MAKIGDRDYPSELDPREAEHIADTLVNQFGGKAENEEEFARAIGHSTTNSGTYMRKVGDARKYGLITPRGLEATDLANILANPKSRNDRIEARFRMLKNVSLLADLYEHLDGGTPGSELWRLLTRISGATPNEAKEAEKRIQELYDEMLTLGDKISEFKSEETSYKNSGGALSSIKFSKRDNVSGVEEPESKPAIHLEIDGDEIKFSELTERNIEIVKDYLDSKKDEISDSKNQFQMKLGK